MDNRLNSQNIIKCNLADEIIKMDIPDKSKCKISFIKSIKDENYYKLIINKLQCCGIIL